MTPRPAASLVVVREGTGGPEVLMLERPSGGFFGGLWVFPGGAVETIDQDEAARRVVTVPDGATDLAWRAAGLRETAEEVGLALTDPPIAGDFSGANIYLEAERLGVVFDGRRLGLLSQWVTPPWAPVRFDARFYLALFRGDPPLVPQDGEVEQIEWVRPDDALSRYERGEWRLVTPTLHHLQWLDSHRGVDTMWEAVSVTRDTGASGSEADGSLVRVRLPIMSGRQ